MPSGIGTDAGRAPFLKGVKALFYVACDVIVGLFRFYRRVTGGPLHQSMSRAWRRDLDHAGNRIKYDGPPIRWPINKIVNEAAALNRDRPTRRQGRPRLSPAQQRRERQGRDE